MEQQHQEESCVPPGLRFHPTEEELVGYYLARKVAAQKIDLDIIHTNRAMAAGFWKATGRDKPVTSSRIRRVIGMRKTLVFYRDKPVRS